MIIRILLKQYTFLFSYHAGKRLCQTQSLRDKRSLNPTSTTSQLMFAHPSLILLPLPVPSSSQLPPSCVHPPCEGPSPLLRDVGPSVNTPASPAAPAPPLPEGCGRLIFTWPRSWGRRNTRGDLWSGRPVKCVFFHPPLVDPTNKLDQTSDLKPWIETEADDDNR